MEGVPDCDTGGLALWITTTLLGGRAEPWDSGWYWTISYPLSLIGAAVLGYVFPSRPWRWALVLVYSQALVLAASGSGFGLLPPGLVLLAILCLPAIGLAKLGARVRLAEAASRGGALAHLSHLRAIIGSKRRSAQSRLCELNLSCACSGSSEQSRSSLRNF